MTGLAIVIATRNRDENLSQVLTQLRRQTLQPAFIVVSDSSENDLSHRVTLKANEGHTPVHYLHSSVASSARQRNDAIEYALKIGAEIIQILDDDTIPNGDDFLSHQLHVLESAPSNLGVSGVTYPRLDTVPKKKITRCIFRMVGLHSSIPGHVTRAGIGIPIPLATSEPTETEWLFACSMWKREVFDRCWFRNDLPGTALGEDVEFSVRAAQFGTLVVCPHCVLLDENSQAGRLTGYLYWYRQVRNRWFIVQAQPRSFGVLAFTLSNIVLMSMHFVGLVFAGSAIMRQERIAALRGCFDGFIGTVLGSPPK